MNYKIILAMFLIFLTALVLRTIRLNTVLPYLSNDEISIAYDAYSLSQNGKDEHNTPLPITFLSNGTYKAPAYSYILIPFVKIFGNTDVTAKLPSVILGSLTVLIIGLIALELSNDKLLMVLSSLMLSITPWHIYTSRMVLESNVALFFFSMGIWMFLVSLRKKLGGYAFLTSLFLVVSIYSYHTEWVLVPLLSAFIVYSYIRKSTKLATIFILTTTILITPLTIDFIQKSKNESGHLQASSQNIWKDPGVEDKIRHQKIPLLKPFIALKALVQNYAGYINPGYLFFNDMNLFERPHPLEMGLLLAPSIYPLIIGLKHYKKIIGSKYTHFFVYWLLISPLVAASTKGGFNQTRNLVSVIPITILIGIGSVEIFNKSKIIFSMLLIFLSISLFYFQIAYFYSPKARAGTYQGYRPIAEYLKENNNSYKTVRIDDWFGTRYQYVGVPHLFLAYYNRLDPKILQYRRSTPEGTYYGKYLISQIDWKKETLHCNYLYVVPIGNTPAEEVKNNLTLVKEFTDVDSIPAFQIWAPDANCQMKTQSTPIVIK